MTVYTRDGKLDAKAYHTLCGICKTTFWHSYEERENTRSFYYSSENDLLMTSRITAFTVVYLNELSVDVKLGRSFGELCERFNILYKKDEARGEVFKTRLEDAFFIKELLDYNKRNLSIEIDKVSNRLQIDSACGDATETIFSENSRWVGHVCGVKGCREGFVMCDGNEKICRRICAAPKEHFRLGKQMPNTIGCCANSPLMGGKHQSSSVYCAGHQYLNSAEPPTKKVVVTVNMADQKVSAKVQELTRSLPSNSDTAVHTSCKKATNIKTFHDKTAGIMAIVRPCGIIIDHR